MRMRFHANPLTARRGAALRRGRSTARGSRRSVTRGVGVLSVSIHCCICVCFSVTELLIMECHQHLDDVVFNKSLIEMMITVRFQNGIIFSLKRH